MQRTALSLTTWNFAHDLDGSETIDQLVGKLRGIADTLEELQAEGGTLDGPVSYGIAIITP